MTSADSTAAMKELGRKWWLVLLFGVITLGFGIVLTFKPGKSVHTIAIILGIWLLILGVVRLIQAIGATGERTGLVVVGLLSILIAILLLHHTTTTVATVGFIVGIFWTIGGVTQLFSGFSRRRRPPQLVRGVPGCHLDRHRDPVPGLPLAVAVDHLRDRGPGHDPLRHRRGRLGLPAPQAEPGLNPAHPRSGSPR